MQAECTATPDKKEDANDSTYVAINYDRDVGADHDEQGRLTKAMSKVVGYSHLPHYSLPAGSPRTRSIRQLVLMGLKDLHSIGTTHRNIKLSNE